jgi:hypothetical protein
MHRKILWIVITTLHQEQPRIVETIQLVLNNPRAFIKKNSRGLDLFRRRGAMFVCLANGGGKKDGYQQASQRTQNGESR